MDTELISAVSALAFASRTIERALDHMTLPQFRVLALIAASPERARRLADRASVTPPSLTGILDGLVTRGWVARSDVDGDRRGVTLAITPEGQRAFDDAKAATSAALDGLLSTGSDKNRARVLGGLVALQETLRAAHEQRVKA